MYFKEYPIRLNYEDLQTYTDNFSDQNYMGDFQFGKVYHGKITLADSAKPKFVTVKIWRIPKTYTYFPNDNAHRLMDEISFLHAYNLSYPGFMKLYGYCIKPELCGIVYDFKAYNTLFNLAPKGKLIVYELLNLNDEFTWSQRIKVALRLAQLLRYLHVNYRGESPLLMRSIHAAHVMVDEDWKPIIYDFGMISGGMFPDKLQFPLQHVRVCHGSEDNRGDGTQKADVYAFGIVLLSLIMKDVYTDEDRETDKLDMSCKAYFMQERDCIAFIKSKVKYRSDLLWYEADKIWPRIDDENFHFSLVHESLEADESFYVRDGPTITRLAEACVDYPKDRPTMNQVINQLQKLQVVRRQPELNVYVEGKEKMKRKDMNINPIPSRKMEVEREDIASRKVKVKKENIPSEKFKVKKRPIPNWWHGKLVHPGYFIPQ